jgi:DNA-directed RNA polymerase specialized sigma24 family protein
MPGAADEFDDFYKSTRTALLQQTFALTGDLPASRSAVRDAFVAAWHHWRKVSRLEDREAWVRPLAWRLAQRRHSARIFHRDRKLDPGIRATLDALAKLPLAQRKILLLTNLTDASMADMAREVGMPLHDAEQRLQTATSQFAMNREVPTTSIRPLFEPLSDHVSDAQWPRVTIVRRAGTARRRTHTAVGAVAAVGALVLGGAAVTDAQGVKPSLENVRSTGVAALRLGPAAGGTGDAEQAGADVPDAPPVSIAEDDLVSLDQLGRRVPGRWRQAGTGGQRTGILMPCQSTRFADPDGTASAVQRFKAPARNRVSRRSMVQAVEMSTTNRRARAAHDAMLGWFGGCSDARVQLISTYEVGRVGDSATLMVLRSWNRPETTMVAGVARTGRANTVTFTRTQDAGRPDVRGAARLLADAVNGLCSLPDTGPCAEKPEVAASSPVPVGAVPAMLSEVDLPPVAGVARPWIGTEARMAKTNLASSRCDATSFAAKPMKRNMTRSFVIPEARLSDLFGLTETVGLLPEEQARKFVASVRTKLRTCADRELGTDVVRVTDVSTRHRDITVWHVTTEISDAESMTYLMGILRDGGSVAQVGFVPDGKVQMAPGAFISLVHRALDRLPALAGES